MVKEITRICQGSVSLKESIPSYKVSKPYPDIPCQFPHNIFYHMESRRILYFTTYYGKFVVFFQNFLEMISKEYNLYAEYFGMLPDHKTIHFCHLHIVYIYI